MTSGGSSTLPDLSALRDALLSVLQETLRRTPGILPVKIQQETQRIVQIDNGYRTEYEPKWVVADQTALTIDMLMMQLADPIVEAVEAEQYLRERLLVDAAGQPITGDLDTRRMWLRNCMLARFVSLYLGQCEDLRWREDAFDSAFAQLSEFLTKPTQYLMIVTALTGIALQGEELEVCSDLNIRRLDLKGKQELFDLEGPYSVGGLNDRFSVVNVASVVRQRIPWIPSTDFQPERQAQDQLARLVASLRLMGPGRVLVGKRWTRPEEPYFGIRGTSYGGSNLLPTAESPLVLFTDKSTGGEVLNLMTHVEETGHDDLLTLALRRFESAYDRRLDEDRLIDHWIGLEALFTSTGERQETVDKISRRIGRLLGTDSATRSEVRDRARVLYDIRSRVVHGGKPSSKGPSVSEAADETEQLLRRALRLRLKEHWTVAGLEEQMMA